MAHTKAQRHQEGEMGGDFGFGVQLPPGKMLSHQVRKNWDSAFKRMNENGEDEPIIPEDSVPTVFDWNW